MIIAVNIGSIRNNSDGYDGFLLKMFLHITERHSDHKFFFLSNNPDDVKKFAGANVKTILISRSNNPILWKYWYDVKLPSLLKKINAAVFVSCTGICSLSTSVPQCLVISNHEKNHSSLNKLQQFFFKKYTSKFIAKARTIATASLISKKNIQSHYAVDPFRIYVIPPALRDGFFNLSEIDKLETKQNLTGGKEYFLYKGDEKDGMTVLKAFSIFKKKQLSTWKLVLILHEMKQKKLLNNLMNYKYRDDVVVITSGKTDSARIVASAYAIFCISEAQQSVFSAIEAMKLNVPVIAGRNAAVEEMVTDAALYADANDHNDIAEKLMQLYKDERLRADLVDKGAWVAQQHKLENSASILWQCINDTVSSQKLY